MKVVGNSIIFLADKIQFVWIYRSKVIARALKGYIIDNIVVVV